MVVCCVVGGIFSVQNRFCVLQKQKATIKKLTPKGQCSSIQVWLFKKEEGALISILRNKTCSIRILKRNAVPSLTLSGKEELPLKKSRAYIDCLKRERDHGRGMFCIFSWH